jgi:uroporphyrin-III C-methyltransferase/precorrin-2 dehydrogenase/sirohydrochlorin ferrochelatase
VFVATGDAQLNSRVFSDAEQVPVPVNVVDDRKLCRFISPAVVDRSPVQVAISTGGSAPLLARRFRSWIEALLPQGMGQVARRQVMCADRQERLPQSQRKQFRKIVR